MDVLVIARMGSSRLPGKTLMPFGSGSLISHIVNRLVDGGVKREEIILCTSDNDEDLVLREESRRIGCRFFAGDPLNVSRRVLDCAGDFGVREFLLVLGDNPWISPRQVSALIDQSAQNTVKYIVTPTPELPDRIPDLWYPIGTRLQYINADFLRLQYQKRRSREAEEHLSLLFQNVCSPSNILNENRGWDFDDICDLNISINTKDDLDKALTVLHAVGPEADLECVVNQYGCLGGRS